MNNVKNMILVEPRAFEAMESNQLEKSPLQVAVSELDQEMNKILSRTDLPSSEKVKLYDNVLQRYMVYKNKLDHTIKKFA